MIQAIMLVSLGFLAATLLALIVAPAAWARAVRLTSHRIRSSLPINETEIRAEKDQLRASHAVTVHQLEKKIERAELSAARQRVELSRRDAEIVELRERSAVLSSELDENRNARHVLAQTLNERLPRAEERLQETRGLLKARDDQVAKFVAAATMQQNALTEANALIAQKEQELRRLNAALLARESAARQQFESASHEQFVALQAEVEELRARNASYTTSNAGLLERIQQADQVNGGYGKRVDDVALEQTDVAADSELENALTEGADVPVEKGRFGRGIAQLQALLHREKDTTQRLRTELASANDRAAQLAAHYRDELKRLTPDGRTAPSYAPVTNGNANHDEISPSEESKRGSIMDRVNAASEDKRGATEKPKKNGSGSDKRADRNKSKDGETTLKPESEEKSSEEKGVLAKSAAAETSSKTGTLLQRLKGYEES